MSYTTRWTGGVQQWECAICEEWVVYDDKVKRVEDGFESILCKGCALVVDAPPAPIEVDFNEQEIRILAYLTQEVDLSRSNIMIMSDSGYLVCPSVNAMMDLKQKMRLLVVKIAPTSKLMESVKV